MFACWMQQVANKLQIPKHMLYVSPAGVLLSALVSQRLFVQGLVPITRDTRGLIFDDIPGLPPTQVLDLPSPFVNASSYAWMWLNHNRFRNADVILLNTFHNLEKPVIDALRNDVVGSPGMQAEYILDIRLLLLESDVGNKLLDPNPCIEWLNSRAENSVLFVSFESAATHSVLQLMELAQGLEASGVSLLWIVRPPDAPGFSAASEAVSVTEFLPLGFDERVRERGLCYSPWAPQTRVLKHPAVGGFLSHCGWNSSLETVCAGLPVLAWPKFAEQHLNHWFLVDSVRVAIELKGRAYTKAELDSDQVRPALFMDKEEIAIKARSLMLKTNGKIVRQNVQKLRARAQEVDALGGSLRQNFEAYVRLVCDICCAPSKPCL